MSRVYVNTSLSVFVLFSLLAGAQRGRRDFGDSAKTDKSCLGAQWLCRSSVAGLAPSSLGLCHRILNEAIVRRAVDGAVHVGESPDLHPQSYPKWRKATHCLVAQELGVGKLNGAVDVVGNGVADASGTGEK